MHLSYRSARSDDFSRSLQTVAEKFVYPADLLPHVSRLWGQWLREGIMTAHIIEQHRHAQTKAVGLGAVVFVRPEFIVDVLQKRHPYVRRQLIEQTLAGHRVVVTPEEMRAQNRGEGLTLLFLSDPSDNQQLTEDECRLVDAKWSEALYELRGCNFKNLWHEAYGLRAVRLSMGCGLSRREDWTDHWSRHSPPPENERPYLLGMSKSEALDRPGTHASFLFLHVPPQFDFTARQQELLQQAISGATDEDLASQLNVSSSAVKKRWISVYERVSDAMPGWLESAASAEARGSEKRRHLLNYLRQHPEELHPACATRD
jgi:hypothetical protein